MKSNNILIGLLALLAALCVAVYLNGYKVTEPVENIVDTPTDYSTDINALKDQVKIIDRVLVHVIASTTPEIVKAVNKNTELMMDNSKRLDSVIDLINNAVRENQPQEDE